MGRAVQYGVQVFGALADPVPGGRLNLHLPEGSTVSDLLAAVRRLVPGVPPRVVVAVNREAAPARTVLRPGDEVAVLPPFSGG